LEEETWITEATVNIPGGLQMRRSEPDGTQALGPVPPMGPDMPNWESGDVDDDSWGSLDMDSD
jgi:hypothetical protein